MARKPPFGFRFGVCVVDQHGLPVLLEADRVPVPAQAIRLDNGDRRPEAPGDAMYARQGKATPDKGLQICRTDKLHCEKTPSATLFREPGKQASFIYHKLYLTLPRSLYRRSLKLALDWAVHRHLWRGQALYIRSLFEANRNITDTRKQRVR